MCMVGPAYPSVRILLTAQANHNTCLGEITAGSTRVLKGLCFIKTKVSVLPVKTHIFECQEKKKNKKNPRCASMHGVRVKLSEEQ